MLGSIFQDKFGVNPKKITLKEIENISIKKVNFLKYAENIVSKRGNIFKNLSYDIDNRIDSKLKQYF